ncbi:MAG: FtsX-like permease family protein, partial [Peptostreptococcaceae bacterium]|nr:FtsX-like permease family protein [Peptostreptococcaceae bacterium]
MKNKILAALALKNIKANRLLQIPYILANGTMSAMFYIMLSLIHNEYVQSRHSSLPMMMEFGVLITGIVLIIFSLYANRFLMGRRNKELALYGVMGLEKKHIARVLLIEQLVNFTAIAAIAILGGFLIGKLVFWSSNILLQDKNISFDKYSLDLMAIWGTMKIILLNMTLSYLFNIFRVRLSNPIELMNKQFAGEREPKVNWIFLIIGLICMGVGYYIALTVEGSLQSLMHFFTAILFVMAGTYGLFISLSVAVLKMLKNNKKYYYRTSQFISTSGMLYRMKSNAVGLASICILCSGIIVVLAVTLTIYSSVENQIGSYIPLSYRVAKEGIFPSSEESDRLEETKNAIDAMVQKSLQGDEKIGKICHGAQVTVSARLEGERFVPLTFENGVDVMSSE